MAKKKELAEISYARSGYQCAHIDCKNTALCWLQLKTGKTRLCRFHYDQHFQIQADRNNDARGLNSASEMRAWCRQATRAGIFRTAGAWWKQEVLSKVAAGEKVTVAAYELATGGRKMLTERIPGEDDE